jgi:D-glycero-D-manno-heptose 1,7-bisphosphate phosphatase
MGDRLLDVETAARAGVKGILVLTGYGRGEYEYLAPASQVKPAYVAADLLDAAAWIIKDLGEG